ncbi:MAG: alpha/beta hydrolase [Pseudomonadota bacterium]
MAEPRPDDAAPAERSAGAVCVPQGVEGDAGAAFDGAPRVLLLHGLGRSPRSLRLLARRLRAAGLEVAAPAWPATRWAARIAEDAALTAAEAAEAAFGDRRFHAVGHSLGGVLAAQLKARAPLRVGRIVALGAPFAGSPAAARAARLTAWLGPLSARARLGPALDALAEGAPMAPALPAGAQALCVAGTRAVPGVGAVLGLTGRHDGRVARESALALPGAARADVRAEHAWLPLSAEAARCTVAFLRDGPTRR